MTDKHKKDNDAWWKIYRFKQELDICGDYDDDDEPYITWSRVTGIDRAKPKTDDISKVVVRKYDRHGNLIEEITEIHNYTKGKIERER